MMVVKVVARKLKGRRYILYLLEGKIDDFELF
jgi:hypothetical protein